MFICKTMLFCNVRFVSCVISLKHYFVTFMPSWHQKGGKNSIFELLVETEELLHHPHRKKKKTLQSHGQFFFLQT